LPKTFVEDFLEAFAAFFFLFAVKSGFFLIFFVDLDPLLIDIHHSIITVLT